MHGGKEDDKSCVWKRKGVLVPDLNSDCDRDFEDIKFYEDKTSKWWLKQVWRQLRFILLCQELMFGCRDSEMTVADF